MQNFTLIDTFGTLNACLALLPFMVVPGYVLGWALDLFEFRQRRTILKLILSVPLSIALCPMLSYLMGRFLQFGLWVFYIGVFAAGVLLLAREFQRAKLRSISLSKHAWIALGLVSLWAVVAIGSTIDIQIGDQLYPPIVAFDHSVRTAMTVAIAHHIPPENPFFVHAGAPLRYHYLWLLFCSLPMKIFPLAPRHVVNASVFWCGLGLACTIALGLKFLMGVRPRIEQKTLLAVALLCVTGLDILPTLYFAGPLHYWLADTEKWNEPQITSWAGSLLWVPHHVAALIACFVGFLLLRYQADAHRRWAAGSVIVAGLAFASAAGMSVYVTFTFVIVIALWLLALIARKNWLEMTMFVAAGIAALVWALPFLSTFRGAAGAGSFVEFELRSFPLVAIIAQQFGVAFQSGPGKVLDAVFLPINYVLELGFFLGIGILRLRQLLRKEIEASANELAAWTMVVTSFLIGTFLRSSTLATNDLGWRCFLPAQLVLLLWAAMAVHDWWFSGIKSQTTPSRWTRRVLAAALVLGVGSTALQVFMLRMFPILLDRGAIIRPDWPAWVVANPQFGKRAYALRSAYQALDTQLPSSAVLQSKPHTVDIIFHMLYSGRDAAAGNGDCGIDFGGDANACAVRLRRLEHLFEFPDGSDLDSACRAYGIDAVVVENLDPVWKEPSSWVWTRQADVANDYVRAFRCLTAGGQN
ncbi:MAG: hypothetical protein WAU58_00095 [Terriglobales bacterium]